MMEDGKPPFGWLVETEGRKELWMSFAEDGFPDIMKVRSYSEKCEWSFMLFVLGSLCGELAIG